MLLFKELFYIPSKKVHENIVRVYLSFMRRDYHFQPEIANLKASNQQVFHVTLSY